MRLRAGRLAAATTLVIGLAAAVPAAVTPASASHDRFEAALPIPPELRPPAQDPVQRRRCRRKPTPQTRRACLRRLAERPLTIDMELSRESILPGARTPMTTFDGSFPGPTIRARSGRPIDVRFRNRLPVGSGPKTIHRHGGHNPAEYDGQPAEHLIDPGAARTYSYPLREGGGPERAAFEWYHDHLMDETGRNVWNGLAGMFILEDRVERELPLPAGRFDVPLMIVDRSFNEDNSLANPFREPAPDNVPMPGDRQPPNDEVVGDHILVNGAPQPHFDVADRRYRLRVLNASNFQAYNLSLEGGRPLTQIGTDSGLLPAPVERESILLGPAERAELIVDFHGLLGKRLRLESVPRTDNPPAGSISPAVESLLEFRVKRDAKRDPSRVPGRLRAAPSLDPPAQPTKTWSFNLGIDAARGPVWTINGQAFAHDRIDAEVPVGETVNWELTNDSTVSHLIHVHGADFQLIERNGQPPRPWEQPKETFLLDPQERIRIAGRFTDFTGKFVIHCHMLEHEDHGMMANFAVTDGRGGAGAIGTAALLGPPAMLLLVPLLLGAGRRAAARLGAAATLSPAGLRLLGIACLGGIALCHAGELPAKVAHAPYMGLLFGMLIAGAVVLAWTLATSRSPRLTWALSGAAAGLAILGYVVSRTVGLPGIEDHVGHWLEPAGVASLLYEGALVWLAIRALELRRFEALLAPALAAIALLLGSAAVLAEGPAHEDRPGLDPAHASSSPLTVAARP